MLCCEARAFRPFFYSAENAHAYESGPSSSSSSFLPPRRESCPRFNRTRLRIDQEKGGPF